MKKLNKVAMMFAVAALATAAGAQTRVTAANGGPVIDNWQNGTGELVWKNGTNELCWRDANWTPATAAAGCDGALVRAAAPAGPAVIAPSPAPAPVPPASVPSVPVEAPAPVAAAPAAAPTPAPEPATPDAGTDAAPRKAGWWSRVLGNGE